MSNQSEYVVHGLFPKRCQGDVDQKEAKVNSLRFQGKPLNIEHIESPRGLKKVSHIVLWKNDLIDIGDTVLSWKCSLTDNRYADPKGFHTIIIVEQAFRQTIDVLEMQIQT